MIQSPCNSTKVGAFANAIGAWGPYREKKIREIRGRHSKVSLRTFSLFISEQNAIGAFDVDLTETARHEVKACCQDYDIELVFIAILHLNTSLSESLDGVLLESDDINVALLVYLVVSLLE